VSRYSRYNRDVHPVFLIPAAIVAIAAIAFGVYMGIWWALIGGIIGIIEQVKATEVDSFVVAISVAKVLFFGAIGGVSAALGLFVAAAIAWVGTLFE